MVPDEEMKNMLKEMIEGNEICAVQLKELEKKGVSYDKLWNDALYSDVSICLHQLISINTFIYYYFIKY